jgi:hypothetical protein
VARWAWMVVMVPGRLSADGEPAPGSLACLEATRAKEEDVCDGHHHDIFNIAWPAWKARRQGKGATFRVSSGDMLQYAVR